jgi:hypothetical protein
MVRCAVSLAQRLEENVAKILVIDIERLPGLARIWEPKTRYVPISQFVRAPSLLCWAAKWYGSDEMMFASAWDDAEAMVSGIWDLYDQADIVVTYNGVSFDNRHLRSEWLMASLSPPAPWKDVDLYRVNSSTFGFESKSLQHLCQRLGLDTKSGHYDAVMAEACMAGDAEAQATMRTYNEGDVTITEQAYLRLLPWIRNHPHVALLPADDPDARTCNRCGSSDLARTGTYRAVQINYLRYRCNNCGANVRGTRHSRAANTHGV